ncbi:hypothetical protein INT47_012073 [Mucor saturninus]|uniref:ATP-dependent DNA helicase n=1 Tax=Mucor saturninus TaxID=64648 RepID=A0A8H7QLM4_9FUNG|nr:hypothetical protein INT47_012073 [Mucor saturninus]
MLFEIEYDQYLLAIRSTLFCTKVMLKRNLNEITINNYNPMILHMHQANMDIQFIFDPYACCMYIVDYVNKSNKEITNILETVLAETVQKPGPLKNVLRSLTSKYYNLCEVSSQEASYNLLQLRMSETSRATVFIPTGKEETRCRMLKSKADLEKLNPESEDIFLAGLLEHYQNRPESLMDYNLAQFAAYFTFSKKKPKKTKKHTMIEEDSQNEGQDDDNDGDAAQELGENYDWIELEKEMGHKTQKYDLDDIDILSLYTEKFDALLTSHAEFSLLDEEALEKFAQAAMNQDHEEEEEGEDNQDSDYVNSGNAYDFKMYSLSGNIAVDINDEINGYQETEADSGPVPDQSFSTNAGASSKTASTRNNGGTAARYIRPDRIDKLEYELLLSKLNMEQRDFLTHVMNHVRHENCDESPLRLFVTGGAGTGNSLLIKTLFQSLIRHYDVDRSRDLTSNYVILTAFTGKIAFNIYGQTLHTTFHFPNNQTDIHELSSDIPNTMTAALAELKVVIIDEISLVSTRHFLWIDKRLRDIFGRDLPFGGRHMLLFGDFNQLPPVHDFSFYMGFLS